MDPVTIEAQRPAEVPYALRVSAAWSWRLLLLGVVIYLLGRGFTMFQVLVVPVLLSLLIVALVRPIYLRLAGGDGAPSWHKAVAGVSTIVITLGIIVGLVTLIGQQIATGFPSLQEQAAQGLTDLQKRLADSPLHLTNAQIDTYINQVSESLKGNSGGLVSGALQVTSTAGHVATGFFIVIFCSYFFLSGGQEIWNFIVGMFPAHSRPRVTGAALRAWATLTAFIRATLIVALVDGVGVGVGAAIIGVPLAVPLGVLVFLGAFVPIVGALVSGAVAVLVALVAVGPLKALAMMLVVILVQQIEAHGLQPFLLGRAVQLHPLAVILAIGAGVLLAGIVGALFAVPLLAVLNAMIRYLLGQDGDGGGEVRPDEEQVGPLGDSTQGEPATDDEEAEERAPIPAS